MTGRVLGGVIFIAAALIVSGFALALWYEAFAVLTGRQSTISSLSASAIAQHPHIALLSTLVIGVLLGALVTHFTRWST